MQGNISLVSELGLGSKFTVTIPYSPVESEDIIDIPDESWDIEVNEEKTLKPREVPLRILLAEDIPSNCQVASLMFARLGHRLDIVGNGKEALEALERQAYDVVFMDWNMPQMDGITATKMIRQRYGHPEKPWIIAMTAHAMPDHQQTCLQAGMNDFVAKPIECNSIAQALLKCPDVRNPSDLGSSSSVNDQVDFASPQSGETFTVSEESDLELPEHTTDSNFDTVIDSEKWEELLAMAGIDNLEMINELVENFLKNSQKQIESIEKAISNQSLEELRFATHSLKGSSQSLGVLRLSEECIQIETLAKQSDWESATNLLPNLQNSYTLVKKALEEKCEGFK